MKKIVLALLAVLLLTACAEASTTNPSMATPNPLTETSDTTPDTVIAEGKLFPAPYVELAFAQGGVIAEVLVKSGDQVAAGEVLARLVGTETVQAELAAAQLEQLAAQQALDSLHRNALLTASLTERALLNAQSVYENEANAWNIGNRDEASDLELTIDDYVTAEQEYRDARDKLNGLLNEDEDNRERRDAEDDFDREKESLAEAYSDLLKDVAANDRYLDDKQVALLNAISALEVARANQLRLDENNLDPELLVAAETRLTAATAQVTAAKSAVQLYELRAPFAGSLLSFDVKTGEAALPGLPVAFLANTSTWIVDTKDLAEIDIASVAIGQSATVKLDAFPGDEFSAKVTAIDPVGKEYLGDMTYKVTVTLDEADSRFMWNMTATVAVDANP